MPTTYISHSINDSAPDPASSTFSILFEKKSNKKKIVVGAIFKLHGYRDPSPFLPRICFLRDCVHISSFFLAILSSSHPLANVGHGAALLTPPGSIALGRGPTASPRASLEPDRMSNIGFVFLCRMVVSEDGKAKINAEDDKSFVQADLDDRLKALDLDGRLAQQEQKFAEVT